MNQLYVAIITDLMASLTQVLQVPRESGDEPEAIAAAKKSLAAAVEALKTAGYYSK